MALFLLQQLRIWEQEEIESVDTKPFQVFMGQTCEMSDPFGLTR